MISLQGGAFVVVEYEVLQHVLDTVLHREELAGAGLFGQIERAACARQAVGALGEEVVGAVSLSEVVVLPRLTGGGCAGQYGLSVDEDLDGADVSGEVVGLLVGG